MEAAGFKSCYAFLAIQAGNDDDDDADSSGITQQASCCSQVTLLKLSVRRVICDNLDPSYKT